MTPARTRAVALIVVVALVGALIVAGAFGAVQRMREPGPAPARGASTPAAAPSDAAEELQAFYGQRIRWTRCSDGGRLQCARLEVPVDYADPGGDTIELALLRAPARDANRRIGSLVVNPGGPGGSGTEYAAAADRIVSPEVRNRYDIVGFDPRGVADSAPLDCLDDRGVDRLLATDASPDSAAEVRELDRLFRTFANGCKQRSGELLPYIGTLDVARDLDVLRGSLGDDKLTFLGKSYGTFIGATYAGLFPSRVGRMVLDGAVDPRLTGEQFALGQARGFERALTAYLRWCVENDCPLGDSVDAARARLQQLLEELDARPLPVGDRRLTEALAVLGIALPLYLTPEEGYPPLSSALRQAIAERDGAELLRIADIYARRNRDGTYDGNQNEAIIAVNCLDRQEDVGIADVQASLERFRAASATFGEFVAWSGLACSYWPAPATLEPGPVTASGAAPIVVVGTTGDPATPYEWAVGLAEQLESGRLITYVGNVHTAYGKGSRCVDRAVDAYLLEGTAPAEGLRCD